MDKPKFWKLPTDGVMIIWSSTEKYYLKFSSAITMYHWYKNRVCPRYNEVIRNNVRRKFFLDIDGEPNIDRIITVVNELFGDAVVFRTSPNRYHIVALHYHTTSQYTCKWFAEYIKKIVDTNSIDMGCYTSVKCLRLEGSYKDGYVKTMITNHTFLDGLVTHINDDSEELLPIETPKSISFYMNVDIDDAFVVREIKDNMTLLDRIRPSYCKICNRIHDKENAAIINGKFVCWRHV